MITSSLVSCSYPSKQPVSNDDDIIDFMAAVIIIIAVDSDIGDSSTGAMTSQAIERPPTDKEVRARVCRCFASTPRNNEREAPLQLPNKPRRKR